MFLTEHTLKFLASLINGKLRIYTEGYSIDIFRGSQHYYSISFSREGRFDGIEEYKIPKRRIIPPKKDEDDTSSK